MSVDDSKLTFENPRKPKFKNPSEFVGAAGKTEEEILADQKINQVLPWKESQVREDHKVCYNVRLPEPLYLKIEWLSKQSALDENQNQIKRKGASLHSFIIEGISESVEKKVKKRLKEIGREFDDQ